MKVYVRLCSTMRVHSPPLVMNVLFSIPWEIANTFESTNTIVQIQSNSCVSLSKRLDQIDCKLIGLIGIVKQTHIYAC